MKNKYAVLINGLILSISIVTVSTIVAIKSNNQVENNIGELNSFKAQVKENGDISQQVMLKSGKYHVNTTIKGATLENDGIHIAANSYAVWTNDEDSPIRGINSIEINFNRRLENLFVPQFYGSYNPLNLQDILDGYYHDLTFSNFTTYSLSEEYLYKFQSGLNLGDSRYFLAVIPAGSSELVIENFTISTPCGEEITRDDTSIGTFPSEYPTEVKESMPELSNFGNGSYTYTDLYSEIELITVQSLSIYNSIISDLENDDFSFVGTINESDYYQKQSTGNPDLYITYEFSFIRAFGGDLIAFCIHSPLLEPSLAPSLGWPEDKINLFFSDTNFKNLTSNDPNIFGVNEKYAVFNIPEYECSVVEVNLREPLSISEVECQTYIEKCRNYIDSLVTNYGYTKSSEDVSDNEYHARAASSDGIHEVIVGFRRDDTGKVNFYIEFLENYYLSNE